MVQVQGEITEMNGDFVLKFLNGSIEVQNIGYVLLVIDTGNILLPVENNRIVKPSVKLKEACTFIAMEVYMNTGEHLITEEYGIQMPSGGEIHLPGDVIVIRGTA